MSALERPMLSTGDAEISAADMPSDGVSLATPEVLEGKDSLDCGSPLTSEKLEKGEHRSDLGASKGCTASVLPKANLTNVSNTHLTQEKDGQLEVRNGTVAISATNPVLVKAVEGEKPGATTKEDKPVDTKPAKNFIVIRHFYGSSFRLPWALSQTWKDVKEFIKDTCGANEEAKKMVDEEKFTLRNSDGHNICCKFWDELVEPGWVVVIQFTTPERMLEPPSAQPLESVDPDSTQKNDRSDQDFETVYKTKVNYTVAYYQKSPYQTLGDEFLFSKSYNNPVSLETATAKARELAVLEEKTSVTLAQREPSGMDMMGRMKKEDTPNDGLTLHVGDVVGKRSVRIHSPFLLNVLRSIVKYSSKAPSGDQTDQLEVGEFQHPYEDLFYHTQELAEYKQQTTGPRLNHTPEYNEECDRHIDFLLDYLNNEPGVQLKSLQAKWAKKVPTTTFAGLWILMKPGSDVYVEEDGQLNAYVVDSVSGGVDYQFSKARSFSGARNYCIRVWNLKYDGQVFKRMSRDILVPVFDNEREIMSLPLFPTRFQDAVDGGARRNQLIDRGKTVFRISKAPAFLEYTGFGLKPGWKKYKRARVVVEHESQPWIRDEFRSLKTWHLSTRQEPDRLSGPLAYTPFGSGEMLKEKGVGQRARGPRCECSQCTVGDAVKEIYVSVTFSNYDDIKPKDIKELSEHQYLLCMSHMFGFILKDRTYDLLDVGCLFDVNIVENAIDRLVMRPEENKATIKAIVKTYTDNDENGLFRADFIHGKGEGQIFLLHGPPGTGKTLTAESVAEYTRRPLLSITAADLGHEPLELEKNLLQFFKDANNWDAIVLLDEADVYLERRSTRDLSRNSIVSIFLRAMDYFTGILFLTTNRVGHFDEAFMSRIHVSIGYERLDENARSQIWEALFEKLKEDRQIGGPNISYEYDAKCFVKKNDELKKLEWNGREIRNAFQTAVALAIFDGKVARERARDSDKPDNEIIPQLKEKHLIQVVKMSAAFKKYITATHEGMDSSVRAFKLGNRHDGLINDTTDALGYR
ncbi:hypothetical protein BKA56DRAFT_589801 [Ilyonectria sp. MPI-CAGE-AT-0026]|nr:hypothetical protein BKA56DRAFT_589801 [Ilyonectria sp. MPI-CAGE-AT-0026]